MARAGVIVVGLCLVLYFVLTGQWAFLYLTSGEPIGIAMGAALIVLPLIGAWAILREVQFGIQAERLGTKLDAEGGMPPAETELTPSGRIAKADAEPIVQRYAAEAEAAADDWRARYRLGVVQDAAGRRKDARASIRDAIRLAKDAPGP
ncbi:hypothetical protein [Microbacterium aerolatum]|uniref:Tetratricopeptide repeat protein n=1 Tax=Microbacterium aerolatum TaxID=153731 RepID=A0A511AAD2_9MICO|nr:hypothetical protein [Microbacterium aerolatum]GEK85140.1 hypothetical protein MAE01_03160 [Microbacterium aerolatum]GGB29299.1 hypothetical protein GCM10007198_19660 [Microbacterium aerolatum]